MASGLYQYPIMQINISREVFLTGGPSLTQLVHTGDPVALYSNFIFKILKDPFAKAEVSVLKSKCWAPPPGSAAVKTPRFHCSGCSFHPWLGN